MLRETENTTTTNSAEEEKKNAVPEASPQEKLCPACSEPQGNLISLNQTSEEQEIFMKRLDEARQASKNNKASITLLKKRKHK